MNQALSVWANAATQDAPPPRISITVPFYNCAVAPLAQALSRQAGALPGEFELIFADDGSPQAHWREALQAVLRDSRVPAQILSAPQNLGRSAIRNRLIEAARAEHLLFIDADMLPDRDDFLLRYLKLADGAELIYGGRSYQRVPPPAPPFRLYHAFSLRTECTPAWQRQRAPARYVMTNNLLVRRELLLTQPFAEEYQGWGYEDTDWAMGLPERDILHIDNSASHLGLIEERTLLAKMDESAANFLRIAARRSAFRQVPAYRAARLAARLPTRWLALLCRRLALLRALPLRLRCAAVQGYRLAIYARALRQAPRQ